MGPFGPTEILIILVIALVVFGPKRLPEMGKSLGKGIRQFRESVSGLDELTSTTPPSPPAGITPEATREETAAPEEPPSA